MKKILIIISLLSIYNILFSQSYEFVWTNIGPNPNQFSNYYNNGRINICQNIQNDYIYGSCTGGIWLINSETNYCLSEDFPGGVNAIAFNNSDSNEFYFDLSFYANGKYNNDRYSYGLFHTKDKGKNIEKLIEFDPAQSSMILQLILSKKKDTLYILTYDELFAYYIKQKELFTILKAPENKSFLDMCVLSNGKIAISGTSLLFYFNPLTRDTTNLLFYTLYNNSFIKVDSYKNNLWAIGYMKGKTNFILKFPDNGKDYILTTTNVYMKDYVGDIWAFNDSVIYAGGLFLYKSLDSGKTFKKLNLKIHPDIRHVSFPDSTNYKHIIVSTDGGVYNITNLSKIKSLLDTSFFQSYSFDTDIAETVMICGVHDNGTLYTKDNKNWGIAQVGDGAGTAISRDGKIIIGSIKGIFYEINNKNQQIKYLNPLNGVEPVIDSNNRIYFPSYSKKISKSILISKFEDKYEIIDSAWGLISCIFVNPKQDNIIYYATYGRWGKKYVNLFRVTFTKKMKREIKKIYYFNSEKVQKITSIYATGDSIYFSLDGFIAKRKVFFSSNKGKKWTNITYNLDNVPVYSICYISQINSLICGNDFGLFELKGNKWQQIKNFPKVAVTGIKYISENQKLYISTYGRGNWIGKIFVN